MPKVSVIIPVYNTEKYVSQCLDSVCGQTLEDIEIICINDCSTDSSLKILQDFAQKDSRIQLIDFSQNKGAAAARNAGIEAATGEYIGFVDSDDFIDLDFYEKLYVAASNENADVAKGNYKNVQSGYVDYSLNEKIAEDKNNFAFAYCSAIFRKKNIDDNVIRFPILMDMEDPVFTFQYAVYANKIVLVENCYTYIVSRSDSITSRIPSLAQIKDKIQGLSFMISIANFHNISERSYAYVISYWFATVFQDSLKNKNPDLEEFLLFEMKNLFDQIKYKNVFKVFLNFIYPSLYDFFENSNFDYQYSESELKKAIDNAEIISFDIFDTLLLRPFFQPTDIFKIIEKVKGATQFAVKRIIGEQRSRIIKRVRQKDVEDVTIDEIYSAMSPEWFSYKDVELRFEEQLLIANQELKKIYLYAKEKNKKIIITSDMYLTSDFLKRVLKKNGFEDFDNLYVSNEYGKTKASGTLFKQILADYSIVPSNILHIGDNKISDVNIPLMLGINTYYYKKIIDRFSSFFSFRKLYKFYQNYPDKNMASALIGFIVVNAHNNRCDKGFWEDFGFNVGGPLSTFFLSAVLSISKARNLTDLFFVARDGYILNKLYERIKTDTLPKNHYIYATRKLCTMSFNNLVHAEEYKKYVQSISLKGNRIGIVDTCAGEFSAQKLIETFFNKDVIGIYLASFLTYKYNYINLSGHRQDNIECGFAWDIIETLLTSFERPIESLKDCKPVYRDCLKQADKFFLEIFSDIYNAEIRFFDDWYNLYKEIDFEVPIKTIFEYIKCIWINLDNTDKLMLQKIQHPVDTYQEKYIALATSIKSISYF